MRLDTARRLHGGLRRCFADAALSVLVRKNLVLVDVTGPLAAHHAAILERELASAVSAYPSGIDQAYCFAAGLAVPDRAMRATLTQLLRNHAAATLCITALIEGTEPVALVTRATLRALSINSGMAERFRFVRDEEELIQAVIAPGERATRRALVFSSLLDARRAVRRQRLYRMRLPAAPTASVADPHATRSAR